ncbi:MAG: hypothetical protein EA383_15785 [Spirochaetaceae bacterium]|nr:MAG: hypothetical protein EA383_15785 [Spirochaetaceae bacterium]
MHRNEDILFLGTGAAQGVPASYSPRMCGSFSDTRDVRSRSSLRIGERYQIDAGPDAWYQLLRERMSWDSLEHLFISHTHSDHLYLDGILQKQDADDHDQKQLSVYLSAPALDWLLRTRYYGQNLTAPSESDIADLRARLEPGFSFQTLRLWEMYTVGELQVCTVPGTHTGRIADDVALNYILQLPNGFRMLYGVDTGYYAPETLEFLRGSSFDLIVLDCTFGARTDRGAKPTGHLDCRSLVRMVEELDRAECLHAGTQIRATHINPDQGWSHAEMDRFFAGTDYPIATAWDGLRLRATAASA